MLTAVFAEGPGTKTLAQCLRLDPRDWHAEGLLMMKIGIIVLNWNGWADTISCVQSLMKLENENLHIYICDNSSTDGSVDRIRNWIASSLDEANSLRRSKGKKSFRFKDSLAFREWSETRKTAPLNSLSLIETGRNGGYAFGNNVGIRRAVAEGCDFFWIINRPSRV